MERNKTLTIVQYKPKASLGHRFTPEGSISEGSQINVAFGREKRTTWFQIVISCINVTFQLGEETQVVYMVSIMPLPARLEYRGRGFDCLPCVHETIAHQLARKW